MDNICANCGSRNINFDGDADFDTDAVGYRYICPDCGAIGIIWYELVFSDNFIIFD